MHTGSHLNDLLNEVNQEINAANELILSPDITKQAITRAFDFFSLQEVPVIESSNTGVWLHDPTTTLDDVFGFGRTELLNMGISGADSVTLVTAHECTHMKLQNMGLDSWNEELICDAFAGVMAGMQDIDVTNFEAALGRCEPNMEHPNGALRAEFVEFGKEVVEEMQERNIELTFENCLDRINSRLQERADIIEEYRTQSGYASLAGDQIDVTGKEIDNLSERAADMERSEFKGVSFGRRVCSTRHGC